MSAKSRVHAALDELVAALNALPQDHPIVRVTIEGSQEVGCSNWYWGWMGWEEEVSMASYHPGAADWERVQWGEA